MAEVKISKESLHEDFHIHYANGEYLTTGDGWHVLSNGGIILNPDPKDAQQVIFGPGEFLLLDSELEGDQDVTYMVVDLVAGEWEKDLIEI